MKRYWLFSGNKYYPNGGMEDFVFDYDTYEEAKLHADEHLTKIGYDWVHIWDCVEKSFETIWSESWQ